MISNPAHKNPIIPLRGVCDPHIHVFGDRMWLFATHDAIPGSGSFSMSDWQIWSSDDCVGWKLESVVRPEDFWMGKSGSCWATDCAERNGRYYFYFSDGNRSTGVGVADRPDGPYRDVLGRPLLDGTVTTTTEYDPSVFRDEDGEYYIVFGGPSWAYGDGCGYFIARLNEDMVSLAETPRKIELDHEGDDKASLNRIGGRYYLSFGGFYAVSDCVYGPYKYIGHTGASIDHTSFCEWNGQLFNAVTVIDHFGEYRSSGLCYVHVKDSGELVTDPLIVEYGVGQYDSNWNRIEAEWFMSARNVRKVENTDLFGFSVSADEDAVLRYPKIRNLADKIGFAVNYDCVGGGGIIELREKDENGRLFGEIKIEQPSPVFRWRNRRTGAFRFREALPDTLDFCLTVRPEKGAEMRIDCFHFFPDAIMNP